VNRYDHTFRTLPDHARRSGAQKAGFARIAICQHRENGFGSEDDEAIVRQFDLSGIVEFWEMVLSEPMACNAFAEALAIHFYEVRYRSKEEVDENNRRHRLASKVVNDSEAGIRQALRDARKHGEPWFIAAPEEQSSGKLVHPYRYVELPGRPSKLGIALVVQPDPPADGVDLSKLLVRPRAAVDWLIAMPKRKHLVPPSLAAMLKSPASSSVQQSRGRTRGTSFAKADRPLAERMNAMVTSGEASSRSAAAWKLIGRDGEGAEGRGEPEAKVKRLVTAAKALRAENNGE